MADAGNRRLLGFLALSIALHALWLAVPLRTQGTRDAAIPIPLNVRLALPPVKKSAVATRLSTPRNALPAETTTATAAAPTQDAAVKVDLDAAFATARSLAKNSPAAAPVRPPQTTMAAAVAGALRNNETIETRGAGGEYVTVTGKTRCVTPLVVPHFLEGKTMLTQCETRKG
jgi:hypothetical protein